MQPFNNMQQLAVCRETGYKASDVCTATDTIWVQQKGHTSPLCPYHQYIYLNQKEKRRVSSNCVSVSSMVKKSWFVLPPAMEYYYKNKNASYRVLPPFLPNCQTVDIQQKSFDILYPLRNSRILVPLELNGKPGRTVFEVTHRNASAELFWYVDNSFIQTSKEPHKISLNPEPGPHILTVTDDKGESKEVRFEVIQKVATKGR
jgi:penicillin-binding protein 1C